MEEFAYLDQEITITSCDVDQRSQLKPASILSICQESAYAHSTLLGFGFDRLIDMNLAWVLSRAQIEITRLPRWREQIRVRTWHKRQSGLFGLRDYIFFDSEGCEIIKVTTSWLIINLSTRRITRIDRVFGGDDAYRLVEYKCSALESEAPRISGGDEGEMLHREHRVRYSDLDMNQHVNNAKYLEWALDSSPYQMEQGREIQGIIINFNHEAKHDELIELKTSLQESRTAIISGSVAQNEIFCTQLEYVNAPKAN